jgi:hypothetical protein
MHRIQGPLPPRLATKALVLGKGGDAWRHGWIGGAAAEMCRGLAETLVPQLELFARRVRQVHEPAEEGSPNAIGDSPSVTRDNK